MLLTGYVVPARLNTSLAERMEVKGSGNFNMEEDKVIVLQKVIPLNLA